MWVRGDGDGAMPSFLVTVVSPTSLELAWPSGREVQVVWHLHFVDRWRLTSVTYR